MGEGCSPDHRRGLPGGQEPRQTSDGRGVRVADLVALAGGPEDGTKFLTALGADGEAGDPGRVERSVPLRIGLERGLLAFGLNGEPLSRSHGGPIRLVIPGYFAVNSVKWVVRLALTADESDAAIQTVRYRLTPPGSISGPDDPSCWEMPVKSWVTSPEHGAVVSEVLDVEGVAFSGAGPVTEVDVSGDGGKTWRPAALGPSDGPAAWSTFNATIEVGTVRWAHRQPCPRCRRQRAAGEVGPRHQRVRPQRVARPCGAGVGGLDHPLTW